MGLTTALLLAAVLGSRPEPPGALALANAAEASVSVLGPIPGTSAQKTIALLLVTADEESGFRMDRTGDSGHSHCAMQVWTDADVSTPDACMRAALEIMHASRRECGKAHPLARYCGGCDRPAAQRIADRRERRAAAVVRSVHF